MSDTSTPVINTDQPKKQWWIGDIYNADNPPLGGQYVPNVNDLVIDYTQGYFRVIAVDYTTGKSTLEPWSPPKAPEDANEDDVLLGAGPGTVADSYRAYIDTSVKPAILALDRRLRLYGSTATSIKVFAGTDIGPSGTVISKFYDQNATLLGENIPLELVSDDGNIAIKAPKVGYTTTLVPDGELLTVVVYDDVGNVVSTCKVLAQNTSFIRAADAAAKYITAISLESPFLSSADPDVVKYPVNMPVESLNLMGRVTFSDGSTKLLPVDNTKFSLFGLNGYVATQLGQKVDLVLAYQLGSDEFSYATIPLNGRMTRKYYAQTEAQDGAYSVKLFVFPVWQSALSGYRLQYYLYNLDRQDVYDVTNLVQAGSTTAPFDPLLMGTVQNLSVALNMNEVDPAYKPWRFVQTFQVTLLRPGNDQTGDNWLVAYTPGQNPAYGGGIQAKATYNEVGNWSLDLSCGETDLNTWLAKVYTPTQPLINHQSETAAPTPNIMRLVVAGVEQEYPIAQWNTILTVTPTLVEGSVVYIEWIKRDAENDLQLGVSGFIVHLQNVPAGQ